ncbi:hypothetical protein VTI74DRAFT_2405 [Chaetomium olivicolor]
MTLYATGFNAWNQLQFEKPGDDEPDDLSSFTCVLRDDVRQIHPFSSYTLVHLHDGTSRTAGVVPKDHGKLRAFGKEGLVSFVEASNGVIAVQDDHHILHQYPSIRNLLFTTSPSLSFPNIPDITQLVAYDTGFAALSSIGRVFTWGDERYTACLGREPTEDSPAETPSPVPDLEDLPTGPITKLAAGGYLLAALTAGNDLYCWGHAGRSTFPPELSDTPTPVVIDDKDVVDVTVGEVHMLVLTSEGEVYVIGDNTNGQLGLPGVKSTTTWTRVNLGSVLAKGETVTGVAAGPRNSFLVVKKQQPLANF